MELRFTGDLSWGWGLILAIAAAAAAWGLYRRDLLAGDRRWHVQLLPWLRALAIFLIVAMLTGPILHHRQVIGELGRVLLFVDGSGSMGIDDRHEDADRKLLIAHAQGWLPAGSLDDRLIEAARAVSEARRSAVNLPPGPPADALARATRAFADHVKTAADKIRSIDPAHVTLPPMRKNQVLREYWLNIGGASLHDLAPYRQPTTPPSGRSYETQMAGPRDWADNYVQRLRAYVQPPVTGDYTFELTSDDASELFLSPAEGGEARSVARLEGYTPPDQWPDHGRGQPVRLEAGKLYLLECLHKEGGGGDHLFVGWRRPDGKTERPIPGEHLSAPAEEGAAGGTLVQRFSADVVEPAAALANQSTSDPQTHDALRSRLTELSHVTARYEQELRAAFAAYAAEVVRHAPADIQSALAQFDTLSRWKRLERLLLDETHGVLPRLSGKHELNLMVLNGRQPVALWNDREGDLPNRLPPLPQAPYSDLASGIRDQVAAHVSESATGRQRTSVVLLTDGIHNDGPSPLAAARVLLSRQVPIYTVGLGSLKPASDLALLEIAHPQTVFHLDRVRGELVIRDDMPADRPFSVKIEHDDKLLWQKMLKTTGQWPRRIAFDFPIEDLIREKQARLAGSEVKLTALPLAMQVRIEPVEGEVRDDNNHRAMHLKVTTGESRLLILDGRARWETRYLRNLFERDRRWKLNTVIADSSRPLRSGDGEGLFPADQNALFAYDLIIMGDFPSDLLGPDQQNWLRKFVEHRGGGMVFIDGPRQKLAGLGAGAMGPMLPVRHLQQAPQTPHQLRPTEASGSHAALHLAPSLDANQTLWQSLPAPHWLAPVQAQPGAEVLVEALTEQGARPAIVWRRYGAGNVLYFGFDESWRWRYEVADRHHQRFWNQVANWIMEQPFAASDRFVSLDAGATTYQPGEQVAFRVRLRDNEGRPILSATAEAILWRDGREAGRVMLEPDPNSGGLFRGISPPMSAGEYDVTVRVTGLPDNQMQARTSFSVLPPENREMALLACDESLLKQMSAASGGLHLREEEAGSLPDILAPLSAGRIVESETVLWQSYWWFSTVLLLLTAEWLIRKKTGML